MKRPFYKRIFILLLLLMTIAIVPFASIVYRRAEATVIQSIDNSSEAVLQQMKYNYNYFTDGMSALCLSTFFRDDTQTLLYNKDTPYGRIYMTLHTLSNDLIATQPSVHSIVIYNEKQKDWYSTEVNGIFHDEELSYFVNTAQQIPKLTPLLRKMRSGDESSGGYRYVFSYFMYDYGSPAQGKGSYVVVNQDASWFVDNILNNTQNQLASSVYLAGPNGELYDYQGVGEYTDAEREAARECMWRKTTDSDDTMGFYEASYGQQRYLVSYLDLDKQGNTLIMLQKYEDFFEDMRSLKNDYIFIALLCVFITFIAIALMSRRIYSPVNHLLDYVTQMSNEQKGQDKDEFEFLKGIYGRTVEANQSLAQQEEANAGILRRYLLNTLLKDFSSGSEDYFKHMLPLSALARASAYSIYVVLLHIDTVAENKYKFMQEDEILLLFSLENVLSELFEGRFSMETTQDRPMELVVIVNSEHPLPNDSQHLRHCVKSLQSFAKDKLDLSVTASYSECASSLAELPLLYEQTKTYLQYRAVFGPGRLIDRKLCAANQQNNVRVDSGEWRKQLEKSLDTGDMAKIRAVLDQIHDEIRAQRHDNITVSLMELSTAINFCLNEIRVARNQPAIINFMEIYQAVLQGEYVDEIFKKLQEFISSVLSDSYQVKQRETTRDRLFVDSVTQYVASNYADFSLSSQSIADHLGMSGRYVMKKFKQCANITLNDYILSVRMRQAAYLLTNSKLPVNKIAENIGIENDSYFYYLFKKMYGCTPRAFSVNQFEKTGVM